MLPLKVKPVRRTAPKTISEKIHEQFVPKPTQTESDDEDGETRPRFSEFDELDEELERTAAGRLSDIRKQNIRYLDAIDRKYQGRVSSRSDVFEESGEEEEQRESGEESDQSESDCNAGSFVRLKAGTSDGSADDDEDVDGNSPGEEEYDDEDEDDDDDEDDDYSLGDFLGTSSNESQKLLQDENRQESIQKGICVQNQLKMWERLLEIRIKMQASLITANAFPHADRFKHLTQEVKFQEAADRVTSTVESTLKNLTELQQILVNRFPESKNVLPTSSKRKLNIESKSGGKAKLARLADFESCIRDSYSSYTPYRNEVLQKWHDRTKVASSSAKTANLSSLSIVKKIENALLSKDEAIRKTQLYRGGFKLFEEPTKPQVEEESMENGLEPQQIYDTEIYDDSDFYHALLRELIEYKSNTADNPQEIGAKLAELQKLRNKMKKQVDTRASKGRKIRYVVHKKLVNFTAPDESHQWTAEAKDELFSSLFGGTAND